jgi:hypothetical protein
MEPVDNSVNAIAMPPRNPAPPGGLGNVLRPQLVVLCRDKAEKGEPSF